VATRLIVLAALVLASGLLAWVLHRRDGRARAVSGSPGFTAADLAVPLGPTATFVQFSSATCAPCRAVRRTLHDLTAPRPDLVHVEVDAQARPDLARRHRVLTTPTVLLLDGSGRVSHRFSGAPDRRGLLQALAELSSPASQAPPSRTEVTHG
jgi:thiol-disulfide isomerase/thioredoxin